MRDTLPDHICGVPILTRAMLVVLCFALCCENILAPVSSSRGGGKAVQRSRIYQHRQQVGHCKQGCSQSFHAHAGEVAHPTAEFDKSIVTELCRNRKQAGKTLLVFVERSSLDHPLHANAERSCCAKAPRASTHSVRLYEHLDPIVLFSHLQASCEKVVRYN